MKMNSGRNYMRQMLGNKMSKKTIRWDTEKETELLALLPDYPILWDPSHHDYMKKNLKNETWRHVAEKLGFELESGQEVAQKFRNLRAVFLRNKNGMASSKRSSCGTDDVYVPKWQHWEACSFMMHSVAPRKSMSSFNAVEVAANVTSNEDASSATSNNDIEVILDTVSPPSIAQDHYYGYDITMDAYEPSSPNTCYTPMPVQSTCSLFKKAKTSKKDLDNNRKSEFYSKCLQVLSATKDLEDPFIVSIANDTAQLPLKKKLELKKILQITVSDFILNNFEENE